MSHLLNGGSLEEHGQGTEALVVQMKVEVHVLVDCLQFVADGVVKKVNALLFVHD
jgi:hypothetical protein